MVLTLFPSGAIRNGRMQNFAAMIIAIFSRTLVRYNILSDIYDTIYYPNYLVGIGLIPTYITFNIL